MMFLTPILSWLGNFLGGPFIKAALEAYKAKLSSDASLATSAEQLAVRELEVEQREIEVQGQYRIAVIGRWYTPDNLMGYSVSIYFAKLLIWDKVFGLGTTDPLAGWASNTAIAIVGFYFGKRSLESALKIWRQK